MTKKHVFHVGDKVKILNPEMVVRVGYPLTFWDLMDEFAEHPNLREAARQLGLNLQNNYGKTEFLIGICKCAVRNRGWGGPQRTIHTKLEPAYKGAITPVLRKKQVMTGIYYPPTYSTGYDGEQDLEPGGLDQRKSHVLLDTEFGLIESINVEPVAQNLT